MSKKHIALLLCLAMLFTAISCSNDSKEPYDYDAAYNRADEVTTLFNTLARTMTPDDETFIRDTENNCYRFNNATATYKGIEYTVNGVKKITEAVQENGTYKISDLTDITITGGEENHTIKTSVENWYKSEAASNDAEEEVEINIIQYLIDDDEKLSKAFCDYRNGFHSFELVNARLTQATTPPAGYRIEGDNKYYENVKCTGILADYLTNGNWIVTTTAGSDGIITRKEEIKIKLTRSLKDGKKDVYNVYGLHEASFASQEDYEKKHAISRSQKILINGLDFLRN